MEYIKHLDGWAAIIIALITLFKIFHGQYKAKIREEYNLKNLAEINSQLSNHITDLTKDVKEVKNMSHELLAIQNKCRQDMEHRVSIIEGKLN